MSGDGSSSTYTGGAAETITARGHELVKPRVRKAPPARGRGMLLGATAMLSGFVFIQAPLLYEEYQGLKQDLVSSRAVQPLGFINIAPDPNYAKPPEPWVVADGDELRLWGRWDARDGHQWFQVPAGAIDPASLDSPIGRDVVRSIVEPLRERPGGTIRENLPDDTPVIGLELGYGKVTAYPLLILHKVEVVNDRLGGRPVLIVHTPFVGEEEATDVFDPQTATGERLSFGLSGHFLKPDRRPILYDYQTMSLWVIRDHTLRCLAGRLAGSELRSCRRPTPVEWREWGLLHPDSTLVVGASRTGTQSARVR